MTARTAAKAQGRGALLFTFAVIADSHVEPEQGGAVPRSNRRNRYAVEEIDRLDLPFALHVGDIVHPVPNMPGYGDAAAVSRAMFGGMRCPVHMLPGNHDIGDKPAFWSPAATVREDWVAIYERHFGAPYHAFDHGDCHFVLINAPIINTGLPGEERQRAWLEADLARNRGKRLFLATHYPPFLVRPDEPGNYDNLDEPGRGWLLGLIRRHRIEAVFCGHVHNFFYNRLGPTDFYILPSSAFVRRDYSEMYRIGPTDEFGRNDAGKVGYFLVDVFERGHVARFERTIGSVAEETPRPKSPHRVRSADPRLTDAPGLGVHLRHTWAEIVEMPYNGPVDEFVRKRARNDYAIEALWDLGIRHVRVPLSDLEAPETRERMRLLAGLGHRFTVFTAGTPDLRQRRAIEAHADAVAAWEIVLPVDAIAAALPAIRRTRAAAGVPVYLARLQTSAGTAATEAKGANFKHFTSHGFLAADAAAVAALTQARGFGAAVDGLVFRVPLEVDPLEEMARIGARAAGAGIGAAVTICLAPDSPSGSNQDDQAIANRVALAALAALSRPDIPVLIDTFVDNDRGYCVRHGLLDRRYNRRLAGMVLRNLQGGLEPLGPIRGPVERDSRRGCELIRGEAEHGAFVVVLPQPRSRRGGRMPEGETRLPVDGAGEVRLIDLQSGAVTTPQRRAGDFGLAAAATCAVPYLVIAPRGAGA